MKIDIKKSKHFETVKNIGMPLRSYHEILVNIVPKELKVKGNNTCLSGSKTIVKFFGFFGVHISRVPVANPE